jgi:hypothetical protein
VPDLRISYTSYSLGPPLSWGPPKKIVRVSKCHIYLNVLQHFDVELKIYYFTINILLKKIVAGFPPLRPGLKPGSNHVGFVVDKVAVFLRVLRFPLPILIPPISPQSPSPII